MGKELAHRLRLLAALRDGGQISDDGYRDAVAAATRARAADQPLPPLPSGISVQGDEAEAAYQRQSALAQVATPRGQQAIICPYCQVHGQIHRSAAKRKQGIHGGKATGAVLTGGLSLLGTGLSRKVKGIQFDCGNCGASWFAS